jgi:hypothetical protein
MIKRYIATAALIAAGMLAVNTARATVVDLSASATGSVTVNGAIFTTSFVQPAGTGVYNPFLTVQNSPWEQGYNSTSQPFDTKRAPQWNYEIKFSDLQITTINGKQYYGFSIDVNEPNGAKAGISLNDFSLWTSSTLQHSTSTDSNGFFNGSLGTLRYDFGNNAVLYTDKNNGSGQDDISVFIPVADFAGTKANDYVYLYQRWGNTDTADNSQGGFEETRLIAGITPVPEMSALFPIVGLMVAVGSTHILRRRRMARVSA